jgi:subtilisin-like proprotein convertase family protein
MKKYFGILAVVTQLLWTNLASAQTFTNNSGILIPNIGVANPSPSTITVSGVVGPTATVTVSITNFNHTFPQDVGAVLVGPTGKSVVLFDGPGDQPNVLSLNWTFTDNAAGPLPNTGTLTSGSFQPGQDLGDVFTDAPARPYGTNMAEFAGSNANGVWSLYLEDFIPLNHGTIDSWSITIQPVPEPAALVLGGIALASFFYLYRRNQAKRIENEAREII